jgi:hypothetical protein
MPGVHQARSASVQRHSVAMLSCYAAPVHLKLHQTRKRKEKKIHPSLVVKLLRIGATTPLQRVQIVQAVITRRNGISGASCSDLSLS